MPLGAWLRRQEYEVFDLVAKGGLAAANAGMHFRVQPLR
jgi:hypothetical protein